MLTIYRIRQNIRGGKLSRFSRILAKRESFTIESFPSSQLENLIIIPWRSHGVRVEKRGPPLPNPSGSLNQQLSSSARGGQQGSNSSFV